MSGDAACKRWAEYFNDLLNVVDNRRATIHANLQLHAQGMAVVNENRISEGEMYNALKLTKTGKAPGVDGCRPRVLKERRRKYDLLVKEGI